MSVEKIRVVIADDSLFLCEYISDYFQSQSDIELVDIAHDGIEAIDKIRRNRPDVALIDCAMPKLDGLGVLEVLSKDISIKPQVCIMVSGIGDDTVTKRAYELGANYCIIKPFDNDILADRIRMFFKGAVKSNLPPIPTIPIHNGGPNKPQTNGNSTLEEQVTNLLHEIGVPANIRGYRCLRTAILKTVENLDLLQYVTKELYPTVARELNTTPSSVERAIRHAIGLVWDHGNSKALEQLFGTKTKKPSNSEFIALIADIIRLKNIKS